MNRNRIVSLCLLLLLIIPLAQCSSESSNGGSLAGSAGNVQPTATVPSSSDAPGEGGQPSLPSAQRSTPTAAPPPADGGAPSGGDSGGSNTGGPAADRLAQAGRLMSRLSTQSEGQLSFEVSAATDALSWIEAEQGAMTREFAGSGSPEAIAGAFLNSYGTLFGLSAPAQQLQVTAVEQDATGAQHVRLTQQHEELPVFGADLVVHLTADGGVYAANGYIVPNLDKVDPKASLSDEDAASAALAAVEVPGERVADQTLVVLNPGLITNEPSESYLTYRILANSEEAPHEAEWIFVDAQTGEVRFRYDAVHEGRNRQTYNRSGTTTSATLARAEGAAAVTTAAGCTAQDVNNAHDFAGDTYDFFFNRFGRDSYNGTGGALNSYVCYGTNYRNAFWNGASMTYGAGFAVDDVVGHELGHGVVGNSSRLIYSDQSGALNESFADIFGESIDLTNGKGNDAGTVRWDMGEEIPAIGAVRDMMDPLRFNNPDSTTSTKMSCVSGRSGAVHTNSGVLNKAFAMLVDGGSLNGLTIGAIGLDKSVQIFYRANTTYLTSSAKFLDAFYAIKRSCGDLRGQHGIIDGDCNNVRKALEAVKLNGPVCGAGGSVQIGNNDFEGGRNVGWFESSSLNYDIVWQDPALTYSGNWSAWLGGADNERSEIAQTMTVPATGGYVGFRYRIASSDSCGRDFATVLINDTTVLRYDLCSSRQTLGYSQGWVDLNAYKSQSIKLRFVATTDGSLHSSFWVDVLSPTQAAGVLRVALDVGTQPAAPVEPKAQAPIGTPGVEKGASSTTE